MSNEPREVKIEPLELNKETITELTEEEAEGVQGGVGTAGCGGTADCDGQPGTAQSICACLTRDVKCAR